MIRKDKKRNYLMVFLIFMNIITILVPGNQALALSSDDVDLATLPITTESDALGVTTSGDSVEPDAQAETSSGDSVEPDTSATAPPEDVVEPDMSATTPSGDSVEPDVSAAPSEDLVEPDALDTQVTTEAAVTVEVNAPVITLIGDAEVNVGLYSNYMDPGVTITDDQDIELVPTVTYTKDGNTVDFVNTFEEGTYIIHYNVTDTESNSAEEVTRTVIVGNIEDTTLSDSYDVDGYDTDLRFSLLSNEEVNDLLAVYSVKINGTQKVGNTLSSVLLTENGKVITPNSEITYEWYSLSSENSESSTLVGNSNTYTLASSNAGQYIKLVVNYQNETFEAISSKIVTKSSSGHSSSTSNNNSESSSGNQPGETPNNPTKSVDGWKNNSNGWEYIENGKPVIGWKQINGLWYLMNSTGTMATGWQEANGIWYFLKTDGAMSTGWQEVNGTWYYLKNDGVMATGWQEISGTWYYLNGGGAMVTGWQKINGAWYYLNSDGSMATGWQEINETWYYLKRDGSMEEN